jgi:predicted O-methyltransferase YrrM
LELGTSLGIATHVLSLGRPASKIKTIEGCPNISKYTEAHFRRCGLSNIELLRGDFKEVLTSLKSERYDLVYIDGNHNKEATLDYFQMLLPHAHNDTVFIIDDIYWSKGMTKAWDILIEHPKVTVSIDTFYWGFLFFRKEQAKQHFVIRL